MRSRRHGDSQMTARPGLSARCNALTSPLTAAKKQVPCYCHVSRECTQSAAAAAARRSHPSRNAIGRILWRSDSCVLLAHREFAAYSTKRLSSVPTAADLDAERYPRLCSIDSLADPGISTSQQRERTDEDNVSSLCHTRSEFERDDCDTEAMPMTTDAASKCVGATL